MEHFGKSAFMLAFQLPPTKEELEAIEVPLKEFGKLFEELSAQGKGKEAGQAFIGFVIGAVRTGRLMASAEIRRYVMETPTQKDSRTSYTVKEVIENMRAFSEQVQDMFAEIALPPQIAAAIRMESGNQDARA